MKKIIILLLLVIIQVTFFSCKKKVVMTGSIRGEVSLHTSEFGDTLSVSGITVKLVSKLYDTMQVTTDAQGKYVFNEVKTGAYEVIIGDGNIAPYRFYIQFVGGSSPYYLNSVKLTEKTTTKFQGFSYEIYYLGSDTLYYITIKTSPLDGKQRAVYVYEQITDKYYPYKFSTSYFSTYINKNDLDYVLWAGSSGEFSPYIDSLGQTRFPGVDTNEVIIITEESLN
jgi:hypothetical protein